MRPPLPWYQARQRHHQKRELQAKIPYAHSCKNPQQNTSKPNPTMYVKKSFTRIHQNSFPGAKGSSVFTNQSTCYITSIKDWGTWVVQLVEHLTLAQVMISRFVSSSPTLDSLLSAQSLEPASDSVSSNLSAPLLLMLCLSVSQN